MRYIKQFFSILLLGAMVTVGCNKKLDVEPQQNITPDQIKTEGDVLAVLYGSYTLLQNPNAYGERFILAADLLASEKHTFWRGTFIDYIDLYNKTQIYTNSIAQGMWTNAYTTINGLNTVISKADVVSADNRAAIVGEAKFLRGLIYLNLVRYYGKPWSAGATNTNLAVPLVLEPVVAYNPATDKKARNTVAEVYAQVIEDLTAGANDLPDETGTADGRASRYSALAILSRVYMDQANYAAAAEAANEVIEAYGPLEETFAQNFNNEGAPSGETLFAIMQTSQSNAGTSNNGLTTFYLATDSDDPTIAGGGRGDAQAATNHLTIYDDPDDERAAFTYTGKSIAGQAGRYSKKYAVFYRIIPVARLSEMYLTRGEANWRKGGAPIGGVAPVNDINEVRARAGAKLFIAANLTSQLWADERFRELAFEGDRLWTLKRLKMNVITTGTVRAYDDNLLVLPIPRREREVNDKLEQNAGYQ